MEIIKRKNWFWNVIGSMCNAVASVVFLLVVTRVNGTNDGGIFALAFSIGQLVWTIGSFEMRSYQATDIREKYKFNCYFTSRIITCLLMICCSIGFVCIKKYSLYKSTIILLVCLYFLIDALSDVFQGFFQLRGRLYLAGRTVFFRVVLSVCVFTVSLLISRNLIISIIMAILISIVWVINYDFKIMKKNKIKFISKDIDQIEKLLKDCLPLFIGAFMIMFIYNTPKFAIDNYLSERDQNFYNILFMPAAIINLFSIFIFRPLLTEIACLWNDKNDKEFSNLIIKLVFGILIITVISLIASKIIGILVLEVLYGVNLYKYETLLLIIMLGGGFSAISTFFHNVLIAIRKQYSLLISYGVVFIISPFLSYKLVVCKNLLGAGLSYLIQMIIISVLFFIQIIFNLLKEGRRSK